MSEMDIISIRISEHEKDYLVELAKKLNLKKQGSDEPSHTKALKYILSFCMHNDIEYSKKDDENMADMRKMLEQIHASIPHLMYHQKFQSAVLANKYSDEELQGIQDGSLQYINDAFAGFQNNKYRYVKAKLNKFGLKTIPLEEGITLWK